MSDQPLVTAFDARDATDRMAVAERLELALAASAPVVDPLGTAGIPPHPGLIGIPDRLYDQIGALLKTKRHLIFYGPPGTGKTTIAEHVARTLSPGKYHMATGSSDWASQDVIGGYQPVGSGLQFVEGFLLENFDRPVVIDELNRTDIDRALGPLFTVLSGFSVTLPYLVDMEDPSKGRHEIRSGGESREAHVHAPTESWRLLATLNTLDKASLYQMSYALSRRFGWVLIDAPADTAAFLTEYLGESETVAPPRIVLAEIWDAVNPARRIGPAPYIDIVRYCRERLDAPQFTGAPAAEMAAALVEGLTSFVVPMLDGTSAETGEAALVAVRDALSLDTEGSAYRDLAQAFAEVMV